MSKHIELYGLKQNNLKNIDVKIELGSFTVICGPSGSGKSSLAFESLYAEGQRRFVESLSNYARQFLQTAPKPLVDRIENIPPALAIEQKNHIRNSRSNVGTSTEVADYLRLLFAKIGEPRCPTHKNKIQSDSISDIGERVFKDFNNKRIYILCPIDADLRIKNSKALLANLLQESFTRIFVPSFESENSLKGEIIDLDLKTKLPEQKFYLLIDRLAVQDSVENRLKDSIRQTYDASLRFNSYSGGRCYILDTESNLLKFNEDIACSICGFNLPTISPALFSFSSPIGACKTCNGFGDLLIIDENKVVPNPSLSIEEGCLEIFNMPSMKNDKKKLIKYCEKAKLPTDKAWSALSRAQKDLVWKEQKDFYGVEGFFQWLETQKYKMHFRVLLSRYKSPSRCPSCHGGRLRDESLQVFIDNKNIAELCAYNIQDLSQFFTDLKLNKKQSEIAKEVLSQIRSRLKFLLDVGVGYLNINRASKTLSGGEFQRLMLAKQLGMGLSQTLYVLDEPTIGLHPRDNLRLIQILKELNELGNTLVVVEHDHDVIKSAQHIIEMGPGSGYLGGQIVFQGTSKSFLNSKDSNTAAYLRTQDQIHIHPKPRAIDKNTNFLELIGCSGHNLKNVDLKIPLNRFVVISGVSGSGKSSLIGGTLYPVLARHFNIDFLPNLAFEKIKGEKHLSDILYIDQKSIGRSSRSNPISYLGAFDEVRKLMSNTAEASRRAYGPGFFSLNVDGGRCPTCKGEGFEVVDMQFMDDVKLLCDTCHGTRFKKETLEIQLQGKNINEILNLTVLEALDFFSPYPKIRRALQSMKDVGLDYIQLGQSSISLSGGECQRLKIAKELLASKQQKSLYILDEPSTGLHFREIELLLQVINKLIDNGGSVILIEHNLEIISKADYIVDMGPEGGDAGGQIVYQGPLAGLLNVKNSHTAGFLQK